MVEPIVSREHIRDLARAAADSGQNVHIANPYPADSAAHSHFERDYWAAVHELDVVAAV